MEHCEICGQQVAHALRSTAKSRTGIACSGTSCGGRIVHAKCANLTGPVLDALAGGNLGLFWFCNRCRRHPERRPVLTERNRHQELTELSAIRALAAKMVESVDENLNHVKCLMEGTEKEDKACQWPEVEPELLPLPEEIWLHVFRYLPESDLLSVRSTCRQWQGLLQGCSSLRDKFMPRFPKGVLIDESYVPEFLFPTASKICFENARIFEVGPWWTTFGQGLTEINFCECKCVLATLLTMLRGAPNLKIMSWSDVMMDTVEGCSEVDFRLDKMEKIDFKADRDAKILTVFEKICPNLKILLLNSDLMMDDELVHAVSFVGAVQSSLETLQITCTDSAINGLLMLEQLQLKQLILDGNDILDKSVVVDLCRKMPSLKGLHLQRGFSLRGSDLKELGEFLPNLECFSTHFPRQMQILPTFLAHFSSSLRHLVLAGDKRERHTICFTATNVGPGCPNLTHLVLNELILPEDGLRQLVTKSPQLTSLVLEHVEVASWSCLYAALAELTNLKQLKLTFLNLLERTDDDYDFDKLLTVEYLNVDFCSIYRDVFPSLLAVFHYLKQLKLYNMEEDIDDGMVEFICQNFRYLEELTIVECSLTPAQEQMIYAQLGNRLRSLLISEDRQYCD